MSLKNFAGNSSFLLKKNQTMPKRLSVVMPNYNDAQYIGEALEAIVTQSLPASEIIVVDDGSTDGSLDVIQKFAKSYPVLRVLKNERNQGIIPTLKRGIEAARGDYVYCPASNDRILPGFFQKCMSVFEQCPDIQVCSTDFLIISPGGEVTGQVRQRLSSAPSCFSPEELVKVIRRSPTLVMSQAVSIVKRQALLENFIPELKWHADGFAFLMMSLRHGLGHVPEPLVSIRVLPHSFAESRTRNWPMERSILTRIAETLKSQKCEDILPRVKRSGVLHTYGLGLLRGLFSCPKHWDFLSPLLVRKILSPSLAGGARKIIPGPLRTTLRNLRNRKNDPQSCKRID